MNKNIIEIIQRYLENHRNGSTIEEMESYLKEKKIKKTYIDIIYESNLFKLHNGMIFLKSSLIKHKEDFLREFEDFIRTKIIKSKLKKDIINYFMFYLPETLFIEWIDINLENKLEVFELLFNLIIKPKKIKDKFRIYFHELVEYYSLLIIYTLLVSKLYENDLNRFIGFLDQIEAYEEELKDQLFAVLSDPYYIKQHLIKTKHEFNKTQENLKKIFEKTFSSSIKYSTVMLKRVIKAELKNFEVLTLLSRIEHKSLYDWLMIISEENDQPRHNIAKDLGL